MRLLGNKVEHDLFSVMVPLQPVLRLVFPFKAENPENELQKLEPKNCSHTVIDFVLSPVT